MLRTTAHRSGLLLVSMFAACLVACGSESPEAASADDNLAEGSDKLDACGADPNDPNPNSATTAVLRCDFAQLPRDVSAMDIDWEYETGMNKDPDWATLNRRQVVGGQVCIRRDQYGYSARVSETMRFTYANGSNLDGHQRTVTGRIGILGARAPKATVTNDSILIEKEPATVKVAGYIDETTIRFEMNKKDQTGTFEWKRWGGMLVSTPALSTPHFDRWHALKNCQVLGEIK